MDVPQVVAVWLHALSTVVVLGYYGILARVILPALERTLEGLDLGRAVGAVESRALPIVVACVLVFTVSGAYLLLVDEAFTGLGQYGSTWATLMLVKHILVAVMVVGGVVVHFLASEGRDPGLNAGERRRWLGYLRLAAEVMTGLGAVILLLTAAAQVG
jgi:uncharacterized membrane protein